MCSHSFAFYGPFSGIGMCSVGENSSLVRRCKHIVINEAAISVLNSGYSRDPQIMHLLRCFFFIKAHFQIQVKVSHILGAENVPADAISCDLLSVFFSQVLVANPRPATVSAPLLSLLVENQPDWTSPNWAILFKNCFQQV